MLGISSILKLTGVGVVAAALAYGGHWLIVREKNRTIDQQLARIEQMAETNRGLLIANELNSQVIRELENRMARQNQQIARLQTTNNQLVTQRDQYMAIFRRHDLTRLALARPGLIQNRINSGTQDVIDELQYGSLLKREEP